MLCNKIQDIKKEVKELKEDKVKHSMNTPKFCSCIKTNEDMKNKVEKIEDKIEEILIKSNPTTCDTDLKGTNDGNNDTVKLIESEISDLRKMQKVNSENIGVINVSIISLQKRHDAMIKNEENKRDLMLKEINEVKEEVRNIEQKSSITTSDVSEPQCKECKTKFTSKECLLRHVKCHHSRQFTCEFCNHKFGESIALEHHMMTVHSTGKQYKCDICKSSFVVEWRLRKHMDNHKKLNVRKCHYFNNMKDCPFLNLGCKFLHEKSNLCKYDGSCKSKKCQYTHTLTTANARI